MSEGKKTLKDVVTKYADIRKQYKETKAKANTLETEQDQLEQEVIDAMIAAGQSSAKFPGIGTISVSTKLVGKIEDKTNFFRYLKKSGQTAIIKQDVNYQALQSWLNDLSKDDLAAAHKAGLTYADKAILSLRR